jgi:uncharacterized protein (DUF58 family)
MSRRHTTLCREGWSYLLLVAAISLFAVLRDENLMLIVAGVLSAPLLLNWVLARRNLRGVRVRREWAGDGWAGQWLRVHVTVENTGRRGGVWALIVNDGYRAVITEQATVYRASVPFSYIGHGAAVRQTYEVRLPDRGRYVAGPMTLSSRFPFGLVRCTLPLEEAREIVIYPRLGELSATWLRSQVTPGRGTAGTRRPGRAPGDTFAVREWRPGDSSRWIHWRKSARYGELIVRQFEQTGDRQLAIVLDLWQPTAAEPSAKQAVEDAISFAATLLASACQGPSRRLLLGIAGDPISRLAGRTSPLYLKEASHRLALAQASHEDRRMELWESLQRDLDGGTAVLLVSTRTMEMEQNGAWQQVIDRFAGQSAESGVQTMRTGEPAFAEAFRVGS